MKREQNTKYEDFELERGEIPECSTSTKMETIKKKWFAIQTLGGKMCLPSDTNKKNLKRNIGSMMEEEKNYLSGIQMQCW